MYPGNPAERTFSSFTRRQTISGMVGRKAKSAQNDPNARGMKTSIRFRLPERDYPPMLVCQSVGGERLLGVAERREKVFALRLFQ